MSEPGSHARLADVAPDGSPVDFYRRLPATGEPELIHAAIGAGASVLDLGCGPGCIAGPLAALGHQVVGVAFLATAAAHLEPGRLVVCETYPPGWDPAAGVGREQRLGDAQIELLRAAMDGGLLEAEVRDGVDGRTWQQSFTGRLLDEARLRELLDAAGLAFVRWLERPRWFTATSRSAVP